MTQMTLSAILLVIGALAYLTSGILIVRALRRPEGRAPAGLRTLALAGFVLHCAGVATEMFFGDLIHFGFGMAVSAMLLIAVAITLTESYVHRLNALTGTVLIIAAAGSVLPVVFPGTTYPTEAWSMLFRVHLLAALAAYSFMTIAVVQAIFLMRMDHALKNPLKALETHANAGLLSNMPNLMAMERILFRIIACGFVCLTLVLILGALATMQSHGVPFVWDHKTLLTWMSWIVFAVLLIGRYGFGWRKTKALGWFWAGIFVLAAAYLIYRFVIEVFVL